MATGATLLLCASAVAQQVIITHIFEGQGLPRLVANPSPDGNKGKIAAWRMCPPQAPCEALPTDGEDHRSIQPGDPLAGTTFEVDMVAVDGERTMARSMAWRGRVAAVTLPGVAGALRVGQRIRPFAASWTGGWDTDGDLLRLEACSDPTGQRCETLSAQGEDSPPFCPDGTAVLGRRQVGWWVRAVDKRVAREAVFAGVGYGRAADIPLAPTSPTNVRSELVGPVLP